MSTQEYYRDGIRYLIGTIGGEFKGIFKGVSLTSVMVNTYGKWAGPEWSAGNPAPRGSAIDWNEDPCRNDAIRVGGADPDTCYSLMDAITKHHDWDYEVAEHAGNAAEENRQKIIADVEMLQSVALALETLKVEGTYTFPCVSGTGSGYRPETQTSKLFTGTLFDETEKRYAALMAIWIPMKLEKDVGRWGRPKNSKFLGIRC